MRRSVPTRLILGAELCRTPDTVRLTARLGLGHLMSILSFQLAGSDDYVGDERESEEDQQ
jgi:hypothetical protein